jgi:SAM-dependent methyltransferase
MIFIDEPANAIVRAAFVPLQGWYAAATEPRAIEVRVNGAVLRGVSIYERPDVQASHPDLRTCGFSSVIDVAALDGTAAAHIDVTIDGEHRRVDLTLTPDAIRAAEEVERARTGKRQWLETRLRCPVCHHAPLTVSGDGVRCPKCAAVFPQTTRALHLIPPADASQYVVDRTGNISAHGYDGVARGIIDEVRAAGGKVLDCGAGLRAEVDETVVTSEITDYSSTDVIAVNQNLPFPDGTFDAVLSMHVLEHVSDPFESAKELIRVLKPGGRAYCMIPLLAPEHGFPYHFFNMTRSGLRRLFEREAEIEQLFVPPLGHPINALQWILRIYQQFLPEAARQRFRQLTVGEIVDRPLLDWLTDEAATALPDYARWTIAANVATIVRKRAG